MESRKDPVKPETVMKKAKPLPKKKTHAEPVKVTAGQRRSVRLNGKRVKVFNVKEDLKERIFDKAILALKAQTNHRNFPRTVKEAMSRPDWKLWKEAIKKEMESIVKKGTFRDLGSMRSAPGRPLKTKMVLTIKYNLDANCGKVQGTVCCLGKLSSVSRVL